MTTWIRKRWVQLLAAGIVGLIIGSASGGGGPTKADLDAANKRASDFQAQVITAQQEASTAKTSAEAALTEERAKIAASQKALDAREAKIGGAESAAKANTFDGDGVYIVGQDVQAGTYKSAGGQTCYWVRKNKNGDIIDNHLGSGPTVVVIRTTDFSIEVSGCEPFTKSG